MRIRPEFRQPLADGRLLFLSPFPTKAKRMTAVLAEQRNHLVAKLADALLVIHAAPGSRTEALCREFLAASKPAFCLDSAYNARLAAIGAAPVSTDFSEWFGNPRGTTTRFRA
jgi:predicted Rossmann fold nucleotide-binding protein DprA/Smf involved in DNA uptake